jgi:hypothetical protein
VSAMPAVKHRLLTKAVRIFNGWSRAPGAQLGSSRRSIFLVCASAYPKTAAHGRVKPGHKLFGPMR